MESLIDLTNQRFGRLTVICQDKTKKRRESYWLCQCDCGKQKSIGSSALRSGQTVSCGCYNNEICQRLGEINKRDFTGKRFGRLTVLKDTGKRTKYRQVIWRCRCDCGALLEVSSGNLSSGNTRSCGCLTSYGEEYIAKMLNKHNIHYKTQVHFSDLKDKRELKFDFGIYKNGQLVQLIEYDGKQHFDQTAPYYSEYMVNHDELKNQYCKNKNIPLLRCRREDLTPELIGRIIK